ncbi:Integrase catalytic domain-containing protein [Citrus sinensis]|uniref:Integrase catalytic domain-containing protein n=1 Tax=Citrus sinensis TaxID=2711 RepID=A0ACB8N3J0_CITSI|nr:Integrase catalytic domain-containing protein [Citrus sinensis]
MKFGGPLSWEEFTKAVLLRFGPTDYEDPSKALSHLKQTTTAVAYQEAFEKLSHQIDGLPQHFLVGCFVAGLRDDIRLDVKIKQPRILADAIRVARHVEERNLLQRKARTSYHFQTSSVTPRTMPNTTASVLRPPPVQKINQNSKGLPSSNGYTVIMVVVDRLTKRSAAQWLEWIPWAEFSYNIATHSSTKLSPFEVVYGIPPPSLLAYVLDISGLSWLHEACRTLFGPYQIIEKVGSVAYKLALPLGSQIHNVFHVSLLRKHLGSVPLASPRLPLVSETSTLLPQPEAILDRLVIRKGNFRLKPYILVKWPGAPVEVATWETERHFAKTYPDFILEDKDIVSGGE